MILTVKHYRKREEIIISILEGTKSGCKQTKLMFYAMITSTQIKEYLAELMQKEFSVYQSFGEILYFMPYDPELTINNCGTSTITTTTIICS